MSSLPDPFLSILDWSLNPENYPAVFLIDIRWSRNKAFSFEESSSKNKELLDPYPLAIGSAADNHGEKTLSVIKAVAHGLRNEHILLVSIDRINSLGIQKQNNLPEAIMSVQAWLNPGDLVVINLEDGDDSFARDSLVAKLLRSIIESLDGIVIMAAGNKVETKLSPSANTFPNLASKVVVVGAVDTNGYSVSRYGENVTCYGVVPNPYYLPDYPATKPIQFGHSSAATAYTAGMVLVMLNYAKSKGVTLTGDRVVSFLKENSTKFDVLDSNNHVLDTGSIPDWDLLKQALDGLGG